MVINSGKYILTKKLDNATDTGTFGALIAGIGRFPNVAVEDRFLRALAVDPGKLPIIPAPTKPRE